MLKIISILIFVNALTSAYASSLAKKAEIVFEDKAIFRIKNKVLFLSDIKDRVSQIETFICLVPDSNLLKATWLNRVNFAKVEMEKKIPTRVLSGIIRLEAFQTFIDGHGVFLDKKFLSGSTSKKCGHKNLNSLPSYVSELVRMESFLRERFFSSISENVKKGELNERVASMRTFIRTIYKQSQIQTFYE